MMLQKPLSSVTQKPDEVIKIIADGLIKSRPETEVVYRPYRKSDVYSFAETTAGAMDIDFRMLYPEAKAGDVVYFSTVLDSCADCAGFIRFIGDGKIFIDGVEVYDSKSTEGDRHSYPIDFKKGENPVTFMVRCTESGSFKFSFMPSVRYWMWARWYLLNVISKSPLPDYHGEEGIAISRLYHSESEAFDGKYVYPEPTEKINSIDFTDIAETRGKIAYALTYATEDTELTIIPDCPARVFVNGGEVIPGTLVLADGDEVLVKLMRDKDTWSFSFKGDGIGIPMIESSRNGGDRWLTLSAFSEGGKMNSKHGPEYGVQFTEPYRNELGEETFWKLGAKSDYVRPYLQSRFFGQWFYALMVGTHGLLRASEAVDSAEYKDYFVKSTEIMVRYFDYMRYERKVFKHPSFIEASAFLYDLDSIGSMGRNLCEFYNILPTPETLHVIDELAHAAKTKIPRFEDGTYHRPTDMWADDMFMSCPFLVRLGAIKHDDYYYEEVIRQFRGFKKRLWMKDEKIFSHIFFLDTEEPNNIPWGRGNGWVYVSISDALEKIPEGFEGREELMELYLEFTKGIVACQDGDGLWHQVLNRPDSYQETSCTGMFLLGLSRGIKNGWIPRDYIVNVDKAYDGLINKKIAHDGNVYDVCMGSSNSKNVEYYLKLGTVDNDDHGTGVILTAISEMMKIK